MGGYLGVFTERIGLIGLHKKYQKGVLWACGPAEYDTHRLVLHNEDYQSSLYAQETCGDIFKFQR